MFMFRANKILHCMIKNILGTIYGLTIFKKVIFSIKYLKNIIF
jgi:hypothetical protein